MGAGEYQPTNKLVGEHPTKDYFGHLSDVHEGYRLLTYSHILLNYPPDSSILSRSYPSCTYSETSASVLTVYGVAGVFIRLSINIQSIILIIYDFMFIISDLGL